MRYLLLEKDVENRDALELITNFHIYTFLNDIMYRILYQLVKNLNSYKVP